MPKKQIAKKQSGSMQLGSHLRDLRHRSGLGLKVVGSELGVSYTYISKIENGVVAPSPKLLERMAQYYGAESDALFETAERLPPDVTAIVQENRDEVVRILRKHFGELGSSK